MTGTSTENKHLPVLIVGAGPTGLVLALWLTKIGIQVRLIDKAEKAGTTSRALVVHARTLEFYRQLGISDLIVKAGFKFPSVNLWVRKQKRAHFNISANAQGLTPFPYVLVLPQDQHEELLITELDKLGVLVERSTELVSFEQNEAGARAQVRLPTGKTETVTCDFLAGCDGAHSVVRHQVDADFQGSAYPDWFYVADIQGSGPALDGELHLSLNESEFMAIFPLKKKGCARLIGVIRTEGDGSKIKWQDVNPRLINEMKIQVDQVNWFSTYHVHHRVASFFQKGRAFLLGDAAHIHSPVGGQGMNTGIGDAVNLAWKLGEVLKGRATEKLLHSYSEERKEFALKLVNTTDRAFQFVSSSGPVAKFVRTRLVPTLMPLLFRFAVVRKVFFRLLSQTGITYRHIAINEGTAGPLHAGDRLPWIESVDNFSALQSLSWQVHIYGDKKISGLQIKVFNFEWNSEMLKKGLQKNIIYLIRPDGYIGKIASDLGTF